MDNRDKNKMKKEDIASSSQSGWQSSGDRKKNLDEQSSVDSSPSSNTDRKSSESYGDRNGRR